MVNISNQAEYEAWDGISDIEIINDFTITNTIGGLSQEILGDVIINGNGYIITIEGDPDFHGLFEITASTPVSTTVTIDNIKIFCNTTTTTQVNQAIFGTINVAHTLTLSRIKLYGDFEISAIDGGIASPLSRGSVTDSMTVGGSMTISTTGYIIGRTATSNLTISNCFSTGDIGIEHSGGIVGAFGDCTIYNCYSLGDITDTAGGIAGRSFTGTIENCYSTGNITVGNGAGITPRMTNGYIKNCYHSGTFHTGSSSIVDQLLGGTVTNCYSLVATGIDGGTLPGQNLFTEITAGIESDNGFGSGTWNESVLLNNYDSYTNIWADSNNASPPVLEEPYILTSFTAYPWAHTTYNDISDFLIARVVVSCFLIGTKILTPNGEIAIENLNIGDDILTSDGRIVEIKNISVSHDKFLRKLVKIPKNYFGTAPNADLYLTENHLFKPQNKSWSNGECSDEFEIKNYVKPICYNLKLPCYHTDILIANGLKCDTEHTFDDTIIFVKNKQLVTYQHPNENMVKFIQNNDEI